MRIVSSEICGLILELFPQNEHGIVKTYRGTFPDITSWLTAEPEIANLPPGSRIMMTEMVFPELGKRAEDLTYLQRYPVGVILFERVGSENVKPWLIREQLANLLLCKIQNWCEKVSKRQIDSPAGFHILSAEIQSGRLDISHEMLRDGWVASGVSVSVVVSVPKDDEEEV